MSFRRRALFLAGLFAAVSCSDAGNPMGPGGEPPVTPGPGPDDVLAALSCTVDVRSPEMRCVPPSAGTGGALGNAVIIGGVNGENVLLTKIGHNFDADSMWFDVTLQNLIGQTLGTVDGVTEDADSIQIFFATEPNAVDGGDVTVGRPSGYEPITSGAPQPYYQYPGLLADSATSAPLPWRFDFTGTVTRFTFTVYVRAKVQFPEGWVQILPDSAKVEIGGVDSLLARVRDRFGGPLGDQVTWSSSDPSVSVVALTDSTAEITGASEGTAWVRAVSAVNMNRRDSILVKVANKPLVPLDSIDGLTNVTDSVPAADGLAANVPAGASLVPGTYVTADSGTATVYADGSYTYRSRAGTDGVGKDTIFYPVTNGTWTVDGKVVVQVALSPYWFVRPGATGDGRDRSPFGSLADAVAAASEQDSIFVLANGATPVEGGVTLKNGQSLIGQGIPTSVTRTFNGRTITLLAAGDAPSITRTDAGAALTLGTDNRIQGLGITAADGAAIAGSNFGTLFVRHAGVNPAGPALLLSTGALDAEFAVLSSTGSNTSALSLTDVTGSLTGTGGSLANPAAGAVVITGGDATITYGGSVVDTMASSQSILVSGRTGGAVTLSGNLMLDSLGIEVQGNTGGTVAFTGSSKVLRAGSHAGVVLGSNTGASVVFAGGGLQISAAAGPAFSAAGGGTVEVTGAGNVIAGGTGTALALDGVSTGAAGVSFASVSADGAPSGIVLGSLTGAGVQVTGAGGAAGSGGTIQNTTGHAVSLSSLAGLDSVHLQHVALGGGAGGNAGIFGGDFGTLRVTGVSVAATGGPALSLSTGTLNGTFTSLGSASSASTGVVLSATDGSFAVQGGTLSNAASTGFAVAGGSVAVTFAGAISQTANNAPLVAVSGSHTGTLTFQTGTLNATTGTGLSFNAADGAYAFNGTTTLNGGDAGIDITNGATGTFTFGTGTSVTSPTGPAFTVYGASPAVTYSGSLAKANAGLLVEIGEQPGGAVTFQTGTLSATAGDGIQLSNADGAATFAGTTTLNGGNARISVVSGSDGVFDFGINTNVLTTTATALDVNLGAGGGTPALVYRGAISTAAGRAASVSGLAGDSVMVTGNFSSGTSGAPTGLGIVVQNNTGGKIGFNGTSKQLFTGANPAVTLASNTGAAIEFRGGGLAVTTTTGAGFTASGGGTVIATGAGNGVTTSTGTPVSLNGVATAADGVVLASVAASGAVNGIALTNVTGAGVMAAGTLTNTTGASLLVNGGSAGLDYRGTVNQGANAPVLSVAGGHTGTVAVPSGTLTATNGSGLQFDNADGSYSFAGTVTLSNTVGGADAGIDVLNGSGGTFTFGGGVSVANAASELIRITNSAPTFTYSGAFQRTTGNAGGILAQGNTGGTITFNGDGTTLDGDPADVAKSLSTGTANAVSLVSNTGTTFVFAGGTTLATTSGTGLNATGGGTVNVTGAGNGVSSTGGGTAVNIQNTTIGGSGVSFQSVSASGGGSNGIVLANTGTGGFQVTGDGASDPANATRGRTTARSGGGTLALGSGGTISGKGGDGVVLSGTGAVTLRNMVIQNGAGDGVQATNANGVTIDNSRITGHTDNSALFFTGVSAPLIIHSEMENNAFGAGAPGADIHNVRLISNTGTGSVQSSVIANTSAGAERQLQVFSTTGTLNIAVTNSRIGGSTIGDGVGVYAFGSSNITATFQNDSIHNNSSFGIDSGTETTQSSSLNITVNNTAFRNNFLGITVAHGSSGTNTFSITNNNFQTNVASSSQAININRLGGASFTGFGLFSGTVSGNTIGTAGVANSGSDVGDGITVKTNGNGGTTRVSILNNTIRNYGQHGIYVIPRDATSGHTLHARIQGNNIAEGDVFSLDGINVTLGALNTDQLNVCLDIGGAGGAGGNTVSSPVRTGIRVRSSGLPAPVITLTAPSYGSPDTGATYFSNRNPAATSASFSNASGTTTAGTCTTP